MHGSFRRRAGVATSVLVAFGAMSVAMPTPAHAAPEVVSVGYGQVGGGANAVWPHIAIDAKADWAGVKVDINGVSVHITTAVPVIFSVNTCSVQSRTSTELKATCPLENELDVDTGNGPDNVTVKNRDVNMQVNTYGGNDIVSTSSVHFQYVDLGSGDDNGTVTAPSYGQDSELYGEDGNDTLTSLPAPRPGQDGKLWSHAAFLYGGHDKDTFNAGNGFYDLINCGKKWSKWLNRFVDDGAKDTIVSKDAMDKVQWCP